MQWLLLVLSLPTENATVRMRAWRALRASGAAVLRDGVYLLPARDDCRFTLESIAEDVQAGGGTTHLMLTEEPTHADFQALFDRSDDYAALLNETRQASDALNSDTALEAAKQARKLRKTFTAIAAIDYFGGEAQKQADAALQELEAAASRALAPDEPHAVRGAIKQLRIADYKGRVWATRRRPWVDRLACAWLIRRYIDRKARIVWLAKPKDCPAKAIGFDFDGATFSHVGARVTFEVMLASFGLEQPALRRIGGIVHHLDAGGVQPAEASGVERVLAGLRDSMDDDDQLVKAAGSVFDALLASFEKEQLE
ncbi:MAG TPA: chromate resistance protein ChrB domain-containing protein [Burkholderiaceae bacterium]|nr:chromate resistance protein ChrB domain-containing protein [Burkholderiaceae bacterium]